MSVFIRVAFAALLAAFFSLSAHALDGVRTETVHFAKGKSGTTIKDRIEGYGSVSYKLGASAGQTLRIKLSGKHNATYFNLYGPGKGPGDEAIATSDVRDPINTYEGALPESGDYTISVYMVRASARRGEVSHYTLDVSIEGNAAGDPMAHDAKVPGTEFHATGGITCSMGGGAPAGFCPFGVVRQGNGSAMVTVTKPDGRTRVIFFDKGNANGYDMSQADRGAFSAERQGDLTIVHIGEERYEIFDAIPFGG